MIGALKALVVKYFDLTGSITYPFIKITLTDKENRFHNLNLKNEIVLRDISPKKA